MNIRDTIGCSVVGCSRARRARSWCWTHYKQEQRAGHVVRPGLAERLWRYIVRDPSGCWLWAGPTRSRDREYGGVQLDGRTQAVHRVMYELLIEPIPDGLHIDHLCRTKLCVNPSHLEPVTNAENMRRRFAQRTVCKHGHPITEENRRWNGHHFVCRPCANERTRKWYERKKATV